MTRKKYKTKTKVSRVKEPQPSYHKGSAEKAIRIFSSFEEENEFVARERAAMSYDQRLTNAEELRKIIFNKFLLPDGSWPPVEKVFKIMKPSTRDIS